MKRPKKKDYNKYVHDSETHNSFCYTPALEKYCDQLEKKLDESKLLLTDNSECAKLNYDLLKELQTMKNNIAELNKTMPEVEPTAEMVDWCDKLEQLTEN